MTFAQSILQIISMLLSFVTFMIFAQVVLSWLFAFGLAHPRGQIAGQIYSVVTGLTEPILRPFRELQFKLFPQLARIDLSPVFALIAIWWVQSYLIGSLLWRMFA